MPIFRALECVYFPFEIVPGLGDDSFKHFNKLLDLFRFSYGRLLGKIREHSLDTHRSNPYRRIRVFDGCRSVLRMLESRARSKDYALESKVRCQ